MWNTIICALFHWGCYEFRPLFHSYDVRCTKCGREFVDND